MITETAYLDSTATTKSASMVATDHSADFTNCENKSQTLNVVTNGTYSFRSSTKQLNETDHELDNNEVDEAADYGRPKKLQKGLANQGNNSNLINQQPSFGQLESNENSFKGKLFDSEQSNSNQQSGGRRKANAADGEYEENFECLASKEHSPVDYNNSSPKVPPLRIVISSSTAGRSSKDHLTLANSNYVVSSAPVDHSSNSNGSNASSQTASSNDKKEEGTFYSTRSAASGGLQQSSSSTSSSITTGRITRSQRAAAAQNHHLANDDSSQSRYSPDEYTHNELANELTDEQQPPNKIYMNSQTIKEKESNKENKDLRRRKGRGKGAAGQSSAAATTTSTGSLTTSSLTTTVTTATSSTDTTSPSAGQLSYQPPSAAADNSPAMESDPALDQSMMSLSGVNLSSRDYQMPSYNCYNMYQNIRRQVDKRRQTMCESIQPTKSNAQRTPSGFKNYLLSTGNYLLESRSESMRNVNPNLTLEQIDVPAPLANLANTEQLIELYREQELEREKLKVQHLVEREKVKLAIEQEILRVHNRAALAMANQSLPLSFTVLMKDEEIYNPIDQEQEHSFDRNNVEAATNQKESTKNEYSRATYSCQSNNIYADLFTLTGKSEDIGSRCRYSGRLLHSWLQDVEDKWSKTKKEILNRQRREAESLQAIQKLNWEWKVRELGKKLKIHLEEDKSAEKFDEKQWSDSLLSSNELIPYLVRVSEEFDLS